MLGDVGAFDCRISQLPTVKLVVDYFRWRHEDAHRNALNAHCYWMLRKAGDNAESATEKLHKLSFAEKNELLYQQGNINFNDIPSWQKRGIGLYWEDYQKEAVNPKIQETVYATRKRMKIDMDLPMKDDYSQFIESLVRQEHPDL